MRKPVWVLVASMFVFALAACGGDDDDSTSPDANPDTTTTSVAEEPASFSESEIRALDYVPALATARDLRALTGGTYETADSGALEDAALRAQCGEASGVPPAAIAGSLLELQDDPTTLSITSSVQGFESTDAATTAFEGTKAIAEPCTQWSNGDDQFQRVTKPTIEDVGDDSFSLWSRKTDTGLLVADHFVRRGPFVYNIRFAVDGSNAVVGSPGLQSSIISSYDGKFLDWADEQLS